MVCYSEVPAAKAWWIAVFDCKSVKIPPNWDDQLPSDVALKLPGAPDATILLCDEAEVKKAGLERSDERPLIFTSHIKKAYEHLLARGAAPTQIEANGATEFFTVRDSESNVIEICREP